MVARPEIKTVDGSAVKGYSLQMNVQVSLGVLAECEWLSDRARAMIIRRASGQTLNRIGLAFGVTRERVRQVIDGAIARYSRSSLFPLSEHSFNILYRLRIVDSEGRILDLESLRDLTPRYLLRLPSCGKKTTHDIMQARDRICGKAAPPAPKREPEVSSLQKLLGEAHPSVLRALTELQILDQWNRFIVDGDRHVGWQRLRGLTYFQLAHLSAYTSNAIMQMRPRLLQMYRFQPNVRTGACLWKSGV